MAKPTADRIPAINACLADLRTLAKLLAKQKLSRDRGNVTDDICMLELVRDYGSYGGKVAYPVNEPSFSVFEKHGIADLIHSKPPRKQRHVPKRTDIVARPTTSPRKRRVRTHAQTMNHWMRLINENHTIKLGDVSEVEVEAAMLDYKKFKDAEHPDYWANLMLEESGALRYFPDSDDISGLAFQITLRRERQQ